MMHSPRLRVWSFGALLAMSLGVGGARADAPQASGRAFWPVPTVSSTPGPEVLLADEGWPQASAFTGFSLLSTGLLSRSQPVFWLARDASHLLVGWRVPKLAGRRLKRQATGRDGRVWDDDAVEIFLDPGHTHSDYYQFIVNSAGARSDAHGRTTAWNADWEIAVTQDDAAWAGVAVVPFTSLGTSAPTDGQVWGFNACVDRSPQQRPQAGGAQEDCNITWCNLGQASTFHSPATFGHLVFRSSMPLQLTDLGTPWWRALTLQGCSPATGVSASLSQAGQPPLWSHQQQAGPEQFATGPQELPPGDYTLSLGAAAHDRPVAAMPVSFRAAPLLDCQVETLALRQVLEVGARLECVDCPDRAEVTAALLGPDGDVLRAGKLTLIQGASPQPLRWSLAGLLDGACRIVLQDEARPEVRADVPYTPPQRPSWLGSKAGIYDDSHVPEPWTPLQVTDRSPLRIDCWGRRYTIAPSGLLAHVASRGQSLLAAPMTFSAEVNGRPVQWQRAQPKVRRVAKGAVEFTTRQTGSGLHLACHGRMEFDGFIKLRVRIKGTRNVTGLDKLALSIPFRKSVARLVHHHPKPSVWVSVDMKRFNSRAVTPRGWTSPFLYYVWVGDEEKGLQWLCESDENWHPADPDKAIELAPDGRSMALRLNLVGKPISLDEPLEYVFAFQASPVKPMPADYRDWHYAQVAYYGMEKAPYRSRGVQRAVSYPAAGNILSERGTLEVTVEPKFDSTAPGEVNRGLFELRWPADTRLEPERGVWLYWNQDDKGMRVVFREADEYTCIYGGPFAWKPGEAHTVAFTWGEKADIYVDAQRIATGPVRGFFASSVDLGAARIRLGRDDSDFVVRQIRISDRPLPPASLGSAAQVLSADEHTLLLDRFKVVVTDESGRRHTRPARIAAGGTGTLSEAVRQVEGGLDLARPKYEGTLLDHYRDIGLRHLGFHEHWTDWQGFPRTSHGEELRSLLAACHERDLRLILYHSWQLADIAPEYSSYLRECENISANRFIYTREPRQKDYPICPRSAWADFMADGLQRLFDQFGADGIYSDGLSYPVECSNPLHGCGYVDEEGQRHPTMPIFAVREAMKRFRHILDQQGKPTLFVCHTSGSIVLPTLAFADAYLDGEHLCSQPRPFRVPLDAFRAELMGHNFGIPAYFLVYDWHGGMTSTEGLALALLHDTELPWSFDAMTPVWKAWEEFGVRQARFLPYWQARDWLQSAPKGVTVSAYAKDDGEMLLVAVNTTEEPVEGPLRLRGNVLQARDILKREPVPVQAGAIQGRFTPWETNLIRLRLTPE